MRLTRPIRSASSPLIILPVITSSLARPSPTTWGSREEPPTSGIRPIRVSGMPITASLAITRRSQASASSIAPPMQAPWITQIVGLAISSATFQASRMALRKVRRLSGFSASSPSEARSMPGGEHRAGAADHDAVGGGVGGGGAQRIADLGDELAVEGVALVGAVEHDVADRAVLLGDDEGHCRERSPG